MNSTDTLRKNKFDELQEENKLVKETNSNLLKVCQDTKEELIKVTTKYEMIREEIAEYEVDMERIEEELQAERDVREKLDDENKALQLLVIDHEKKIFELKEEN